MMKEMLLPLDGRYVNGEVGKLIDVMNAAGPSSAADVVGICSSFLTNVIMTFAKANPALAANMWLNVAVNTDKNLESLGLKSDMVIAIGDDVK